jgi:hypothetical protein
MDWSLPPEAGDTDTLGLIVLLGVLAVTAALSSGKKIVSNIRSKLRCSRVHLRFLFRDKPEHYLWHECLNPPVFARTLEGKHLAAMGKVWRRKRRDGTWEYRQDEPTDEEQWNNVAW